RIVGIRVTARERAERTRREHQCSKVGSHDVTA
ncbi:MAG: hypothetical protein QOI41_6026, partial [Myxococcales bacterium]|nr:hypothetical protein [Myxococcales bacterium]